MTEWVLILLMPIMGFVKGIDIEVIRGFETKEACQIVAEKVNTVYMKRFDKPITALCEPTNLE